MFSLLFYILYLITRRMSRREGQDKGSLVGEGDFAQVSHDDHTVKTGSPFNFLLQALKEVARGESTASAMEKQLASIEAKIDALLKAAEEDEKRLRGHDGAKDSQSSTDSKAT